jgi:elongation factor G
LAANPLVLQLPIGAEADFAGVIDLVQMKALVWRNEELGAKWDEYDQADWAANGISGDLADQAESYRAELLDTVASSDESLMEKFLNDEELTVDELRAGIRAGTLNGDFVPVLTGSAFKNKGVQPLLDAVVYYLPSPLDIGAVEGENPRTGEELTREPDDNAPFSALAFKIMSAPHVGKLTYFRVYSGSLAQGDQVLNVRSGDKERMGRLLEMHANNQEDVDKVYAGDIVAAIGLKNTRTGDTLCDPGNPIVLEQLEFPDPVIHVAVEPKTKADQDKMSKALMTLSEEDPTFQIRSDEETGQTVISGMGELHLEVLVDRMLREFKVDATVGKPQVAYRETVTKPAESVTYTHKKQTGGSGQYAEVTVTIESTGPGGGYEFVDKITGGRIPKEYIPSIDAGIQEAMTNGVLAGYPTVDIRATLLDGKYHDVDSSEMAFKIAGTMVFKEAARKAKPVLLEPIMAVEVVTPEEYLGDVMGDLSSRRGKLEGTEQRGNAQVIRAQVPLDRMFGYATDLRSKTQGRANYTMQFDSYQPAPSNVQEEIIARVRGE